MRSIIESGSSRFSLSPRAGSTISYTSYNLPSVINSGSNSSTLAYGAWRNRYKQVAVNAGATETTIYVAGLLEKVTRGGLVEYRHFIAGTNGIAAIHTRRTGGTPASDTVYVHTDHLGSPELFTNSSGGVLVRPSFSAYGDRRDGRDWAGPPTAADLTAIGNITRHGFTGHEHLDAVNLIHMNGRVYEPLAGRFLSRDPYIDGVASSQGLNGYAYVHNNPVTYIDPSGFVCRDDRGEHEGPNFPDLEVCGERDRPIPPPPGPDNPRDNRPDGGGGGGGGHGEVRDLPEDDTCESVKVVMSSQQGNFVKVGATLFKYVKAFVDVNPGSVVHPSDGAPYYSKGGGFELAFWKLRIGFWSEKTVPVDAPRGTPWTETKYSLSIFDFQGGEEGIDWSITPPQAFSGFTVAAENLEDPVIPCAY